MMSQIHPDAVLEPGAVIGDDVVIWDGARVRTGAVVSDGCVIGRGAFVDHHVVIGPSSKVQNNALLYSPAVLGAGVFVGPAAVLTNDRHPRAVAGDGRPLVAGAWEPRPVVVEDGASLGAGSIVVAGAVVGRWAMVAAGGVVTRDVPAHALVGGVPARALGWVGRGGHVLEQRGDEWVCPATGERYVPSSAGMEQVG